MYKHHIDDLVEAISTRIVPGRKVTSEYLKNSIRTEINNYFKDKIAVIWTKDDVLNVVNDILDDCESCDDIAKAFCLNPQKLTKEITKEDVINFFNEEKWKIILDGILDAHDADKGISWETTKYACIEDFMECIRDQIAGF